MKKLRTNEKAYISIWKQHTAKSHDDAAFKTFLRQVKRLFTAAGYEDELTAIYRGETRSVWQAVKEDGCFSINFGTNEHGTAIDIEFDRVIYFEQW